MAEPQWAIHREAYPFYNGVSIVNILSARVCGLAVLTAVVSSAASAHADVLYASLDPSQLTATPVSTPDTTQGYADYAGIGDDFYTGYSYVQLTGFSFYGGLTNSIDVLQINFYNMAGQLITRINPAANDVMGVGVHTLSASDLTYQGSNYIIPGAGYVVFAPSSFGLNEYDPTTGMFIHIRDADPHPSFTLGFGGTPTAGVNYSAISSQVSATGVLSSANYVTDSNGGPVLQDAEFEIDGTGYGTKALVGDANNDGKVDLSDLNIVLNNLGTSTNLRTNGNFDGAATIDLTDLNDVLNNLGTSNSGSAIVATPEPVSMALLAPATLLLLRRRRA
jgi:hypothetical protein